MVLAASEILTRLKEQLLRLRGNAASPPKASIVIPVNAQTDLENVVQVLFDIGRYDGQGSAEIILVVNNYPEGHTPGMLHTYRELGCQVIAIPKIERTSKSISIPQAARIPGIRNAQSEAILLFDADCRIPYPTDLIDWYVSQFENGMDLAYTHVDYFDLPPGFATKVRMLIHHSSRWLRRSLLRMPTSRGSNYGIRRKLILDLYDRGKALQEVSIGREVKALGGRIAYSGARKLIVYTSGRFFSGGWKELFSYLIWRVGFYNRVFMLRSSARRGDQEV